MDLQDAANWTIPEGEVRNLHDKDKKLLWSAVGYDVKYKGDTTQQTYSGKNLFNKAATPQTTNTTIEELETGIRAICTGNGTFKNARYVFSATGMVGQAITVSSNASVSSTNKPRITIGVCDSSGENRTQKAVTDNYGNTHVSWNITSDTQYFYIAFYCNTDGVAVAGDYVDYSNLQLEIGSTATSYEPYVGGIASPNPDYPQNVNVVTGTQTIGITGKNLFDFQGITETSGDYPNATLNEWGANGAILTGNVSSSTQEMVASKGTFRPARTDTSKRAHLYNESTVTISADVTLLENNYTPKTKFFLDPIGQQSSVFNLVVGQTIRISHTFTDVPAGDYYPTFTLNSNKLKIENIQIEAGSTATDYEQYQGQTFPIGLGSTELCKIGDYQDYIYKSGDDWYVHKECGKIVLDGNESWNYSSKLSSFYRFVHVISGINSVSPNNQPSSLFSNNFIAGTWELGTGQGECVMQNNASTNLYVVINSSRLADVSTNSKAVESLKTWLSTHNTTVYYRLAAATDTKITDNTLLTQLNSIHNWLTRYDYYGVVSGNLPIIIDRTGII